MKFNLDVFRKVLGLITDILIFGRDKGWWKKEKIETQQEYVEAYLVGKKWSTLIEDDRVKKRLAKLTNLMVDYEVKHLGRIE